ADRRRGYEAVLDRADVAFGLAQILRDRPERLIGADEVRTDGHRPRLALPRDAQLADLGRLEDLAAALLVERLDGRDLDLALSDRRFGREAVQAQVLGDRRGHDVRRWAIDDGRADEAREVLDRHRRRSAVERARRARGDVDRRGERVEARADRDAIARTRRARDDLHDLARVRRDVGERLEHGRVRRPHALLERQVRVALEQQVEP